jgi:hypothetical protein
MAFSAPGQAQNITVNDTMGIRPAQTIFGFNPALFPPLKGFQGSQVAD